MSSKVTLHLIGTAPGWVPDFLATSGAGVIKGLNWWPDYPGVETVGRIYLAETAEPEPLSSLIRQGANGGEELFWLVWPEVQKGPPDALWEPYNEAPIWDQTVLNGFIPFNQQIIKRFHEHGRRVCVGAINTSWPHEGQYPIIAQAAYRADGLSLHEYSAGASMAASPDMLRYRQFHNWCAAHDYSHPPIYITECGLDAVGGPDHGHWGWHTVLHGNEEAYVTELLWYEQELRKDDYLRAATVFTTGGSWPEFEFGESVAMKFARAVSDLGPGPEPPDPPEPPQPPDNGGGEMLYFDVNGQPMTEGAFRDLYGDFRVVVPEGSKYRLVELHDSGPEHVSMDFQAYCRPQYPRGARLIILNGGKAYGSQKTPDMQEGAFWACYAPPDVGAYTVSIEAPEPADSLVGGGWLCETGHRHIRRFVFEYGDVVPPEPPEPPPSTRPHYFHKDGSPMTEAEATTMFGAQAIHKPGAEWYPLYEVAELHWSDGIFFSPRVLNVDGNPVRDALVFVKSNKSNAIRKALTGSDGYCSFDFTDGDWSYNAGAEVGPVVCGIDNVGCQIYNTAGKVNDKAMGPRVLNPVFIWSLTPGGGEVPEDTYTLTVTIEPVGAGTVSVSPLLAEYDEGEVVTLRAFAADGWGFDRWVDEEVDSADNPLIIPMLDDVTLVATFVEAGPPPDDNTARLREIFTDIDGLALQVDACMMQIHDLAEEGMRLLE